MVKNDCRPNEELNTGNNNLNFCCQSGSIDSKDMLELLDLVIVPYKYRKILQPIVNDKAKT
jgi:hypothetical protein